MVVEEVRGAVEADRGLPGSRPPLYREHAGERRADDVVLLGLDRRDDVEHHARPAALELGEQRVPTTQADLARVVCVVAEHVVGDRQQAAPVHHEVAPAHEALRIAGARLVEGLRHRSPPLHHHGLAAFVLHVTPADVPANASGPVDPPEHERTRGVGEQRDPPAQRDLVVEVAEPAGRHDAVEHELRARPHRRERLVGAVDDHLLHRELVGHGAAPWARAQRSGKLCR